MALPVKPDDTRRQILHGHAQRLREGPLVKSLLQHRTVPVLLHALAPLYANQLHDTGNRRAIGAQDLDGTRGDEIQVAVLDLRLAKFHARLERAQTRAAAAAVRAAPDRVAARAVFIGAVRPDRKGMALLRIDEPHDVVFLRQSRDLPLHFLLTELQRHAQSPL